LSHLDRFRLRVDPAILERFPGYTAAVIYARDLENGESDARGAESLREAEDFVRANLKEPASAHPHLQAWRSAFSAFGAKPSKFLCSAEALVKRVLKGEELPAIDRVVDAYNAVSLRHVVPAGGEDLDRLESDLELTFSDGTEPFDLLSGDGTPKHLSSGGTPEHPSGGGTPEHPMPGEVVWKDSAGVTCRRWNWRQCKRTRLLPGTRNAYFVIDRLAPYPRETLDRAAAELIGHLRRISPGSDLELEIFGSAQ
jgi:DNA/RNA-binding domain of Phe-tRNA-synthetase-like protein